MRKRKQKGTTMEEAGDILSMKGTTKEEIANQEMWVTTIWKLGTCFR